MYSDFGKHTHTQFLAFSRRLMVYHTQSILFVLSIYIFFFFHSIPLATWEIDGKCRYKASTMLPPMRRSLRSFTRNLIKRWILKRVCLHTKTLFQPIKYLISSLLARFGNCTTVYVIRSGSWTHQQFHSIWKFKLTMARNVHYIIFFFFFFVYFDSVAKLDSSCATNKIRFEFQSFNFEIHVRKWMKTLFLMKMEGKNLLN